MRTIEHEGKEFEYDEDALYDWELQCTLQDARGYTAVIAASRKLFEDADAYAAELGGDIRKMDGLVTACLQDAVKASEKVKN